MPDLYQQLLVQIFKNHYHEGLEAFDFNRAELVEVASKLGLRLPKNLGDLIYSFRYRRKMPAEIVAKAAGKKEWIIEPAGQAKYRFRLGKASRIIPRDDLVAVKLPDATPEIIAAYALTDEQALLAKVRYNRLIDIFLGLTTFSLQNHLRTTVKGMGQIEIDEIYVGVNKNGQQFVIPVQAKGGTDQLAVVQTSQDLACCAEKFPNLTCRAISAQFMSDEENTIAMFELTVQKTEVRIIEERHYRLVQADQITNQDLKRYSAR